MVSPNEQKSKNASVRTKKLRPLLKGARIEKRPLLHPPIPSPYTGSSQQKVVYISAKSPFISVVKRVRKLLSEIDKRATGKIDLVNGKGSNKQKLRELEETIEKSKSKEPEEVVLKGTNRAIQKVLELALYFQSQDDCRVRIRTGGVGTVDDLVQKETPAEESGVDGEDEEEEEDLPESRVRMLSVVEAGISLK